MVRMINEIKEDSNKCLNEFQNAQKAEQNEEDDAGHERSQ
jgi:hypothetical protein